MNLQEDYCSFEISKLLKEKGFDEVCTRVYIEIEGRWGNYPYQPTTNSQIKEVIGIMCPTHQMAMKWLRCRGIYIEIDVLGKTNIKYGFTILKLNDGEIYSDDKIYTVYEEAVEAAIKYCLTKVI